MSAFLLYPYLTPTSSNMRSDRGRFFIHYTFEYQGNNLSFDVLIILNE